MVTYAVDDADDKLSMVLHGKDNHKYLAVGFSLDTQMGEDFVLACLPDDGEVVPRWNVIGAKNNLDKIDNGTTIYNQLGVNTFSFVLFV